MGSADFTESKILAEIYSQALKAKGVQSSTKLGIGSREIYIKALQDQSILGGARVHREPVDHFDANATATTAEEVEKALPEALPSGLKVLSPAGCRSGRVRRDQGVLRKERDYLARGPEEDRQRCDLGGPPELENARTDPGVGEDLRREVQGVQAVREVPPKISDLDSNKIQVATSSPPTPSSPRRAMCSSRIRNR